MIKNGGIPKFVIPIKIGISAEIPAFAGMECTFFSVVLREWDVLFFRVFCGDGEFCFCGIFLFLRHFAFVSGGGGVGEISFR